MNQFMLKLVVRLGLFMIFISLIGCDRFFRGSNLIVEKVSDGDTLVVKDNNQKTKVRFACIDAPEIPHSQRERKSKSVRDKNQFSWGLKAQTRVQQLVQQGGNRVSLDIIETDQYGRTVAEVRLPNGIFVQEILLQEGLAKVYRRYLNQWPSKEILQQAELQAKQQKVGIWNDQKFIDPWQYRRLKK